MVFQIMVDINHVYRNSFTKSESKIQFGGYMFRCNDNIKMNLKEMEGRRRLMIGTSGGLLRT
jgi:hypothetical protein